MKGLPTVIFLLAAIGGSFIAQEQPGPEAAAFLERVAALDHQGKPEDALKLLDEGLEKFKQPDFDRFFLLNYKFMLLSREKRFREAVGVAVEKADIIKSPKQALVVAETYLTLSDLKKGLDWIQRSVELGLQSYDIFNNKIYRPLYDNETFVTLVETVKSRNGIGQPATPFVRESIAGHKISLDKYKGQVVLIDFWATWCLPCREQMPRLKNFYKKYKGQGFEIVGFSEDKDKAQLDKYLEESGIAWEIIFCPEAEKDETVALYRVTNIPASFLVDKNGIVRHVNLSGRNLETAIEELIKE